MKTTTLSCIIAAMVSSYAGAATVSVTADPALVTGNIVTLDNTPATFLSFDSSLGTLTSVEIQVTARERADITIENDAPGAVTANTELSGNVVVTVDANGNNLSDDAFDVIALVSFSSGSVNLTAADVTSGSGPDFHDFGTLGSSDTVESQSTSDPAQLAFFTGDGVATRTALVTAGGGWNAGGVSDVTLGIANFEADAEIVVTYTYDVDAVPEPSSVVLGLAGAGLLAFRRKRS